MEEKVLIEESVWKEMVDKFKKIHNEFIDLAATKRTALSDWSSELDICKALNISPETLQEYRENGKIDYFEYRENFLYKPKDEEWETVVSGFKKLHSTLIDLITSSNTMSIGIGDWLSEPDTCKFFNISPETLQNYRESKKLGYSTLGDNFFYKINEIDAVLHSIVDENKEKE